MLKTLDLFSGIGGFSLGLERTGGFETVAFCEIEPFCRRVLSKHWPGVPIYEDVRELSADTLRRDGITDIDVICGGFPCQDISVAGKGAGLAGERSGLWSHYRRLIGEIRPNIVIVENVAALLGRGAGRVLGDLASLGYDAQWNIISSSAIGAPHKRDRIWIIANAPGHRCQRKLRKALAQALDDLPPQTLGAWHGSGHPFEDWPKLLGEPAIRRMAHGVSSTVDIRPRLHAFGNSVMPQVSEIVGRAILAG